MVRVSVGPQRMEMMAEGGYDADLQQKPKQIFSFKKWYNLLYCKTQQRYVLNHKLPQVYFENIL